MKCHPTPLPAPSPPNPFLSPSLLPARSADYGRLICWLNQWDLAMGFNQLIMPLVSNFKSVLSATVSCHLSVKSLQPSRTPSSLIHPVPSHLLITAVLSIHHLLLQGSDCVRGSYLQPQLPSQNVISTRTRILILNTTAKNVFNSLRIRCRQLFLCSTILMLIVLLSSWSKYVKFLDLAQGLSITFILAHVFIN